MSLRFYPRAVLGKEGANNLGADTNPPEDQEDAVERLRSHSGWRGFTTPARAAKKRMISQNEPNEPEQGR